MIRLLGKALLAALSAALAALLCGHFAFSMRLEAPIAIVMALLALDWLALKPITIREPESSRPAEPLLRSGDSDALLVVSLDSIRKSSGKNDFYGNDWSYSWLNTLEHELGGCSVCDVSGLSAGTLNGKRLMVISRSASSIPGEKTKPLESFARKGGTLILEMPGQGLAGLSGIETGQAKKAVKITLVDRSVMGEPYRSQLQAAPLSTTISGSRLGMGVKVLVGIDGMPAVCLRRLGRGSVITILFDYGLQMVSLRQGVPSRPDYRLIPHARPGPAKTMDLVPDRSMLDNFIPFADLLEKSMFHIIEDASPIPRLWPFPYRHDCAAIMSHDEEYMADASLFAVERDNSSGIKPSFFLIPDSPISDGGIRRLSESSHIGIHWNRAPRRDKVFFRRLRSLGSQIMLMRKRGITETDACRIHTGEWGDNYTEAFRIMNASGILMDSSYLSSGGIGKGYMFGTGLPFHPIDRNGLPFPLYEVPVLVQDSYGNATQKDIARILSDSRNSYHEFLTLLYHPNRLAGEESLKAAWNEALGLMKGHWQTNFKELKGWLMMRADFRMASSNEAGSLAIKTDSPGGEFGIILKKDSVNAAKLNGRTLSQLGRKYILIPVPQGKNTVRIRCR